MQSQSAAYPPFCDLSRVAATLRLLYRISPDGYCVACLGIGEICTVLPLFGLPVLRENVAWYAWYPYPGYLFEIAYDTSSHRVTFLDM
jgi:hypothetical protein